MIKIIHKKVTGILNSFTQHTEISEVEATSPSHYDVICFLYSLLLFLSLSMEETSKRIVGGVLVASVVISSILHRVADKLIISPLSSEIKEEDKLKRDEKGCTKLHSACAAFFSSDIEPLLTGLGESAINWSCDNGWSPLLLATSKGHSDMVATLLNHHADINHSNVEGYTALMIASYNGYIDIVQKIISRKEGKETGWGLFAISNKAETSLFFACVKGRNEIVKLLLQKEKEYIEWRKLNSLPPLDPLIEIMAFNGATPLHAACECGNVELVKILISEGANPNALDINEATPLHLAADSTDIVSLLAKVSDLNAPNSFGSSPLHDSVFQGKLELAKVLLENGASIDITDHDGLLPIHSACRSASPNAKEILELLIKFGGDINSQDSTGRTPLQMCAVKQEQGFELAKILLKNGADITKENIQGWNALHVALSENGYQPTAELFQQYAQQHYPSFLSEFWKDKPRNTNNNIARPPKYCNLTPEQQKDIFSGMPPSLESVAKYILDGRAKNIVVLTGAGISVSAGIPDFRTPTTGLYSSSVTSQYGFANGPAMFDVGNFFKNPQGFYHMVSDVFFDAIFGRIKPTATHKFIKLLHSKGLLLRIYTQNVDTLEHICGIPDEYLVEVHGNLSKYCCSKCNVPYTLQFVQAALARDMPPLCSCSGLIRPQIVFFGDTLPKRFYEMFIKDLRKCDLLIVMGTSLKVLVNMVSDSVPRLLINLKNVGPFEEDAMKSEWNYRDVSLIDECDEGIAKLCNLLMWDL